MVDTNVATQNFDDIFNSVVNSAPPASEFDDIFNSVVSSAPSMPQESEEELALREYKEAGGGVTSSLERGGTSALQSLLGTAAVVAPEKLPEKTPEDISYEQQFFDPLRGGGGAMVDLAPPTQDVITDEIQRLQRGKEKLPVMPELVSAVKKIEKAEPIDLFGEGQSMADKFLTGTRDVGIVLKEVAGSGRPAEAFIELLAEQVPVLATTIAGAKGIGSLIKGAAPNLAKKKVAQSIAVAGGAGAGSAVATYGSNMANALDQGMSPKDAIEYANKRTAAQGLVDASAGALIPIKIGKNQFVNVPSQIALQMAGGAAGEAAGAAAVGEEVSSADLALEAALEGLIGGPIDVAAAAMSGVGKGEVDAETQARIKEAVKAAGTKKAPKKAETVSDIVEAGAQAASSPLNDLAEPTEAQKEAGNYKKGHVNVQGLDIAIETPRGGQRTGIDPDGEPWGVELQNDYGYVKGTKGADNEQVDVFIGDNPNSNRVYIVDQVDKNTGQFDEHKSLVGFNSQEEATQAYLSAYSDDASLRIGAINEVTVEEFKDFLNNGNMKETFNDQSADFMREELETQLYHGTSTAYPSIATGKLKSARELKREGIDVETANIASNSPFVSLGDEIMARGYSSSKARITDGKPVVHSVTVKGDIIDLSEPIKGGDKLLKRIYDKLESADFKQTGWDQNWLRKLRNTALGKSDPNRIFNPSDFGMHEKISNGLFNEIKKLGIAGFKVPDQFPGGATEGAYTVLAIPDNINVDVRPDIPPAAPFNAKAVTAKDMRAATTPVPEQVIDQAVEPQMAPDEMAQIQRDALPLTQLGKDKYADIKSSINDIVTRINPTVGVNFSERLFGEGPRVMASGAPTTAPTPVGGIYKPMEKLIEISLDIDNFDPTDAAYHELWHSLEDVLTADEQTVLRKKYKGSDKMSHDEETAVAFAEWATGRDGKGLSPAVRRAFTKLRNILRDIGRSLRVAGARSVEDIFQEAEAGDLAKRQPEYQGTIESGSWNVDSASKWTDDIAKYSVDNGADPDSVLQKAMSSLQENRELLSRSPDLPTSDDIGGFSKTMIHPRTIAKMFKGFVPVWDAAVRQFERRDNIASTLGQTLEPYYELSDTSKKKVNAILELGRLDGKDYIGDISQNGELTVVNKNTEAQLTAIGERVVLSETETEAYKSVRQSMDGALTYIKEMMLEEAGFNASDPSVPTTAEGVQAIIDQTPSTENIRLEQLRALKEGISNIDSMKRKGYVPVGRFGNHAIIARDKEGKVISRRHFEVPKGKLRQKKVRVEMQKYIDELNNKFPDAEVSPPIRMDSEEALKDTSWDVNLNTLDSIAHASGTNPEFYAGFRDQIEEFIKTRGFRSHFTKAENIPGYSDDFERAIGEYVLGVSSYVSRKEARPYFNDAIAGIDPIKQRGLRKYAETYQQYVTSPQEEFNRWRGIVFYYYLAGNLSSAAVNLTQTPVVTAPYLSAMADKGDITREITKAYADVTKMITTRKGGLVSFDLDKAPADVREDIKEADKDGFLVPQLTFQQMGVAHAMKSRLLRTQKKKLAKTLELATDIYSSAERINRIVTYVASHRLAQMEGTQERANAALEKNELWKRHGREFSPDMFAKWVIDETHFRLGKVNRPTFTRGIGAPIFQMKSFMLNMFELQWQMGKNMGKEGKQALALNFAMLMATAGLYGLPFMEDLEDIIEFIHNKATDIDLDIEAEIRLFMEELTDDPMYGEILTRGPARMSGIDVSKRVGMGRALPMASIRAILGDNQSGKQVFADIMGVSADLLINRPTKIIEGIKQDRPWYETLSWFTPNFIKNPIQAYSWGEEGIQTQNRTFMTPEDVGTFDKLAKGIGFTSSDVARKREIEWMKTRAGRAVNKKQSVMNTRLAKAIATKDTDKKKEILQEIKEHNKTNPMHLWIVPSRGHIRRVVAQEKHGVAAKRMPKKARKRGRELNRLLPQDKDDITTGINNGDPNGLNNAMDTMYNGGRVPQQEDIQDAVRKSNAPELNRIITPRLRDALERYEKSR